jgi:ATP-dependent DNA helicase RecQ
MTDATVPVQKLLCCIIRTKERFGANYIVDVLLGSRQKRIVENGHNFISTWGIGTELSKNDWLELVDVLLAQKFIAKTNDYRVLYLTEKGRDLLVTRERVMLAIKFEGKSKIVPLEKPNKKVDFIVHKKNSGEKILAESGDEKDLEALRIITELKVWRKKIAQEMNVPPYVIFGDKTMYDIAVKKPQELSELLNVHGIGQAKAEQFGRRILKIVRND